MRPGVKQFLSNLSRYYEIVIYTTQPGHVGCHARLLWKLLLMLS